MLPIILTGSLKAGCSPVFRKLNANGDVEIGLGFRSTVFVISMIRRRTTGGHSPSRFEVEDLASVVRPDGFRADVGQALSPANPYVLSQEASHTHPGRRKRLPHCPNIIVILLAALH
jgi:hypothetical protein